MNRNERRLQAKKTADKKPDPASRAAALRAEGMALKAAGKERDAIPLLHDALKLDPNLADVHFSLAMMALLKPGLGIDMKAINKSVADRNKLVTAYGGILLMLRSKGQYKEAALAQEALCNIIPEDLMAWMDLGSLLNIAGDPARATAVMSAALVKDPHNPELKGIFSGMLQNHAFSAFNPVIKQAFLHCFENIYHVNLYRMGYPWVALLMIDPVFEPLQKARLLGEHSSFGAWADTLDDKTGAFLNDPYLLEGLRHLVITDYLLEATLTRLRRYICLSFEKLHASGRLSLFMPFLLALGEQCYLNEYVYAQDEDEERVIAALAASSPETDTGKLALLCCYRSLYQTYGAKPDVIRALKGEDPRLARLITVQLEEPLEEDRLKKDIPVFGAFANQISQAVRNQYEENPYPRWISIPTVPLPNDDLIVSADKRDLPFEVLVAGCGTGRQAIAAAARFPKGKITAIDLSRASIAYGMRKARECGLAERIRFVHADILSMKDWDGTFDMIECSGVLHHMEDPFEGWRILTEKLRPNGAIKIGLYSDIARQPVAKARAFVAEKGYPATLEGIRACRQAIFALPTTDPIKEFVSRSADFFTTSLVRDLIFHVQEHRMTLPQIAEMMERLDLVCMRFLPRESSTVFRYDKMFPDDPARRDFNNWDKFERLHPLTFAGMYQFWAQRTY